MYVVCTHNMHLGEVLLMSTTTHLLWRNKKYLWIFLLPGALRAHEKCENLGYSR